MIMRVLLLWLFCCLPALAQVPKEVRLASEIWEGHTEADGSGLGWEVLRLVFEPAGVRLSYESVPYTRSVGLARSGRVHGWVGAYRDEVPGMHYPRWHYDADEIHAFGLRDAPALNLQNIGQYRLAWMRGYGYEQIFPGIRHFREIDRRVGAIGMLDRGHIDYFLEDHEDMRLMFEAAGEQPERFRSTPLGRVPLLVGFANTPEALALAELFDQRMEQLVRDGSLRPIFERWQQAYPFDNE